MPLLEFLFLVLLHGKRYCLILERVRSNSPTLPPHHEIFFQTLNLPERLPNFLVSVVSVKYAVSFNVPHPRQSSERFRATFPLLRWREEFSLYP